MSYEPQNIIICRNIALAANKQNTFLTPVATAAYTYRQRNPGTQFASITPTFYSDEAQAGKGFNFPTLKKRTMLATEFSGTWDTDAFNVAWALAFAMGADTVSGAGPYTHLFKFLQSTNQMPVTTMLFQDTNDVWHQMPDLAVADLQITGKESGPLSMQFKATGSGKTVDASATLPSLITPAYLMGSDTDILMGPPCPDSSTFTLATTVLGAQAARTAFYKVTWTNAAGETVASQEISIAVPANSVSTLTAPASFPPGVTGCNVYASTATGTETKQGTVAAGATYTEPNTGFTAGTALPTDTTALTSYKERTVQWVAHLVMDMQPNRAPGGGLFATMMRVMKQRANLQWQLKATSADDVYTLVANDTLRNVRIKTNSGASQILTLDWPGTYLTAPAPANTSNEVHWPLVSGDQDAIHWCGQEIFTATVVNSQPTYLTGA